MRLSSKKSLRIALVAGVLGAAVNQVDATTLRVVTWNVNADTSFDSTGIPDANAFESVVSAMGSFKLSGNAQAPDVFSLQELHATTVVAGVNTNVTLSNLTADLNAIYGAGTYAFNAATDPSNGGQTGTGNGPNGLIYNTKTVSINSVTTVGSVAADDVSRTPLRYSLQAVGVSGAVGQFYLYSEHAKALGDATSAGRRTQEADLVRSNADTLGANAHVIFTGDLNLDNGSSEQAYQDLTAAAGTALTNAQYGTAGTGQAYDPLTSTFTNTKSTAVSYATDSDTAVSSRLDFQLISGAVKSGSGVNGLQLVPNTQVAFGNTYYNGSTMLSTVTYDKSVAATTNTGTGLSQTVLTGLTTVTDHLPLMADYTFVVPEPGSLAMLAIGGLALMRRQTRA